MVSNATHSSRPSPTELSFIRNGARPSALTFHSSAEQRCREMRRPAPHPQGRAAYRARSLTTDRRAANITPQGTRRSGTLLAAQRSTADDAEAALRREVESV